MSEFGLRSEAFDDYGLLPERYADASPPLRWTDPPEGTRSLAVVVERRPKLHTPWEQTLASEPETYWLAWGLPPRAGHLDVGVSLLREGTGSNGTVGYALPPMLSDKSLVFVFRLLAVADELSLARGATRTELMQAAYGLILAEADLEAVWGQGPPRFFKHLRRLLG